MNPDELPSGTVTFVFTDIEGSTVLLRRLGGAYQELLDRHRDIIGAAFEAAGGVVIEEQGDALFAAFARASDAVAGALNAQLRLAAATWPQGATVRVRMGIHTGEVSVSSGSGYVGLALHEEARIASAAHGGQVLVSEVTHDLVGESLPPGARLSDLGLHAFKDVPEPRRIYQLDHPGLPSSFPPIRSLRHSPVVRLPAQPTPLIGRETEIASLRRLLLDEGVRLVTLTGPGGIGKTRLAIETASGVADRFPHGVYFVPLETITDPRLVPGTIASVLGVQESPGRSPEEYLLSFLSDRRLLLILDNLEQVIETVGFVDRTLNRAPDVEVLVTSRASLGLRAQREFQVPPLALPAAGRLLSVSELEAYSAVRLFLQRARAVDEGFRLTVDNAPAVVEICRRLDGLPLAIELAAARTKVLSPGQIMERLDDRLGLLTTGPRDLPARQRTLLAAIEWSSDLLNEQELELFQNLGVFSGGFDLAAAERVCSLSPGVDILDCLASLVEKSLVRSAPSPDGTVRFSMLSSIREYAARRLEELPRAADVKRAHAEHFAELAESADRGLRGPQQVAWLSRVKLETDNLRLAMRWYVDQRAPDRVADILWALWIFWWNGAHFNEILAMTEEVLSGSVGMTNGNRARVLCVRGAATFFIGDYATSTDQLRAALPLFEAAGDMGGAAYALLPLGFAAPFRAAPEEARPALERAHRLFGRVGDDWGSAVSLLALGRLSEMEGDLGGAMDRLEEAVQIARRAGVTDALMWTVTNLGWVRVSRRRYEDGAAAFGEALDLSLEIENFEVTARCLEGLAAVATARGELRRATFLFAAADALRSEHGLPEWTPERPRYDDILARLEKEWEDFAADWAAGRTLAVEQAVAEARRMSKQRA